MIVNITIDDKIDKCFLLCNTSNIDSLRNIKTKDLKLSKLVSFSSVIKTDQNNQFFIKIFPSKYTQKNIVKFFFRYILAERLFLKSKAIKEYGYSKKLAAIGVRTPKVYAAGFLLSSIFKFGGIIIYEKLDNTITVEEMLLTTEYQDKIPEVLKAITADYKKMRRKKIHFKDFHMSNILINIETLELYWIDPALMRLL